MKIKPFILAAVFSASSVMVFAQKGEVNSAKNNYEKFSQLKEANSLLLALPNLNAAKANVDKAVVHARTLADPTAWTYKALVYGELALLDTIPETSKPLMDESKSAYEKAIELDTEGLNKNNLDHLRSAIFSQYELNEGVRAYQSGDYASAYTFFNNSLTYRPADTTITYYAGLSAIRAKNFAAGIKSFESLIQTDFTGNNQIYLELAQLYASEGDTAKAISIAAEGAAKFNDSALATREIELSLVTGKEKEVISKIEAQANKEPNNKLYPYYLGIAYSTINDTDKAEEAYLKVLEIDPAFTDAYVNLGGVLLNKGIAMYNKANVLPTSQQKEYDEAMQLANTAFDKALPYLTKAIELDPESRLALENLRTYYVIRKDEANLNEITKKLEELQ